MTLLRTLLSVLLLAALLAPSTARAGEEEDQAELFVSIFSMMCPSLMAEGLGAENLFGDVGGPLATAISDDSCGCINTSFKSMSAREINAMMNEGEQSNGVETMVTGCMAIALKPRIGEICSLAATKEGAAQDDEQVVSGCGCAQKRADALSDEEMTALFNSEDDKAIDALFEGCEPAV